jgi:hypothetical protein
MPSAGWCNDGRPRQIQTTQLLVKSRNNNAVTVVTGRVSKSPATMHDPGTTPSVTQTRKPLRHLQQMIVTAAERSV